MLNSNKAASSDSSLATTDKTLVGAINEIANSFQDGCNTIMQAVTAKGQTPASNSPSDISTAIGLISSGGDPTHGAVTLTDFNNMTDSELLALSIGEHTYGDTIYTNDTASREIVNPNTNIRYRFALNHKHSYNCTITKTDISFDTSILTKSTITFDEMISVLRTENESYRTQCIGKTISGMNLDGYYGSNPYSGGFTIIGKDHDNSSNTFDIMSTDVILYYDIWYERTQGFQFNSRNTDDYNYLSRYGIYGSSAYTILTYANDKIYNKFSSHIKEYIKPMDVACVYSMDRSGSNSSGYGTRIISLRNMYGKIPSMYELGSHRISTGGNNYDTFGGRGCYNNEGKVYEYFNKTGSTLGARRIKNSPNSSYRGYYVRTPDSYNGAVGINYDNDGKVSFGHGGAAYGITPIYRIGIYSTVPNEIINENVISFNQLITILQTNDAYYRSALVGKLVTGMFNTWYDGFFKIIGVDHDGTSNTVDVLSEQSGYRENTYTFGDNNTYVGSNIESYVTDNFYNKFNSNIKSYIKTMTYESNGSNYGGHGKILSLNEMNCFYSTTGNQQYEYWQYAPNIDEGTPYEYFDNKTSSSLLNSRASYDSGSGSSITYYTRSRATDNTNNVALIGPDGKVYSGVCNSSNGINSTNRAILVCYRIGLPE